MAQPGQVVRGGRGRECRQAQYEMLLRCSQRKDLREWNEWRTAHADEPVVLEGADLKGAFLERVNFQGARLMGARFSRARLRGAAFVCADLRDAALWAARLQDCQLRGADLRGASLSAANLSSAGFYETDLRDANFRNALVDGGTLIWTDKVSDRTLFEGVGLDSARVEPALRERLRYNIRRKRWGEWYGHRRFTWRRLVQLFWWSSNYGASARKVMAVLFGVALAFATLYYSAGRSGEPSGGLVTGLFACDGVPVPPWVVPLRAVYFSIVTMTTLGFGDIRANPQSLLGHVLLTVQILVGYGLLGALVTRLAVLFTGCGPPFRTGPEIEEAERMRPQRRSCEAEASCQAEDEPQPE